jgi:alkylhydroperoxidase family enzyme
LIARGQARNTGVPQEALQAAERAESPDPKVAAALRFARTLVERRGKVPSSAVAGLHAAGYGDAEIVEIVATVVLGLFRNYFNLVAGTEIDGAP